MPDFVVKDKSRSTSRVRIRHVGQDKAIAQARVAAVIQNRVDAANARRQRRFDAGQSFDDLVTIEDFAGLVTVEEVTP